jgi:hypothetical protein
MEERFQSLTQKVFKKDAAGVTNEEAQSLASQYPYFAPLHFIRLLQLTEGSESYHQQYQKSILYYPDPLSFEQFVQPQDNAGWDAGISIQEETTPSHDPELVIEQIEVDELQADLEHTQLTEESDAPPFEPETENRVSHSEPISETLEDVAESVPAQELALQDQPLIEQAAVQSDGPAAELTFEPYHTVDYFASQGIKITAETVSQDKFGKQVKSFTDWLKTMKRLPLAELGKNVTPTTERKVENLAEHSVVDADVVTESMAQVWEKQGNITKATEVYHKLSLQNPSKRAYFAAKIDKLTEEN